MSLHVTWKVSIWINNKQIDSKWMRLYCSILSEFRWNSKTCECNYYQYQLMQYIGAASVNYLLLIRMDVCRQWHEFTAHMRRPMTDYTYEIGRREQKVTISHGCFQSVFAVCQRAAFSRTGDCSNTPTIKSSDRLPSLHGLASEYAVGSSHCFQRTILFLCPKPTKLLVSNPFSCIFNLLCMHEFSVNYICIRRVSVYGAATQYVHLSTF